MTVPGPCTQQDAHVSAYPMCICSAGRIGTSLCLEHTCMPHEALRLTVKPSHNVTYPSRPTGQAPLGPTVCCR